MKNKYKSIIYILFAILFLSASEVKADEAIRYNMYESTSQGTIIRHYKENIDIVCCHNEQNPYFTVYKQGNPTLINLHIDQDYIDTICDFKIYNDTIYFCGKKTTNETSRAVVGYFSVLDLLSPNNVNVACLSLSEMVIVRAIEVGWFASRKHVVGVGDGDMDKGVMVDLIAVTPNWSVNYGDVGGDTMYLQDLAIIETNIVVTATKRNPGSHISTGYLWYFPKPSTPGYSLFPCGAGYWIHSTFIGTRYLVKAMVRDRFATAYHDVSFTTSDNKITVSYYNGLYYDRSVILEPDQEIIYSLQDFDCERLTNDIELIASKATSTYIRTKIFEIPDIYPIPSTLQAHFYSGVFFESINRVWTLNLGEEHFVVSGYEPFGYGTPYYMKFLYNYFDGDCLETRNIKAENKTIETSTKTKLIEPTSTTKEPLVIVCYKKETKVKTQCYSQSQIPETENE